MIKPWINLIIASIFETGWTYSLKYMNFGALKDAYAKDSVWSESVGIQLAPFIFYVIFGGGNIYFLQAALKEIPTTTAIAVWTAFSLVMIKLCDMYYFKTSNSFMEFFFLALIVIGIIGLKYVSPA